VTHDHWSPAGVYLNTASYGLPPDVAWEAMQAALADWRGGRTSWEHWGEATERSREAWAAMVGVDAEEVTVGATVSGLVGLVVASLPEGVEIVAPDVEFTSALFPLLVAEREGRARVRLVAPRDLPDAIGESTGVVAFSAVQMSTGEVADLEAIAAAAERVGAMTIVDATQACGWLPIDASRFDVVACAAYKWLMCPRGVAFMALRRERVEATVPWTSGWYAGEDVHSSYFGPPLRLADAARRLDTSPAWFSWVGAQPALELINAIGVEAIHAHNLALANRFRAGLGLEAGDSAIVSVDRPDAAALLDEAGIVAAVRGGRLRASWHVYNTEDDVDRVLDVLTTARSPS
jgi:selenocysteine lyase/cysteine desulfurase